MILWFIVAVIFCTSPIIECRPSENTGYVGFLNKIRDKVGAQIKDRKPSVTESKHDEEQENQTETDNLAEDVEILSQMLAEADEERAFAEFVQAIQELADKVEKTEEDLEKAVTDEEIENVDKKFEEKINHGEKIEKEYEVEVENNIDEETESDEKINHGEKIQKEYNVEVENRIDEAAKEMTEEEIENAIEIINESTNEVAEETETKSDEEVEDQKDKGKGHHERCKGKKGWDKKRCKVKKNLDKKHKNKHNHGKGNKHAEFKCLNSEDCWNKDNMAWHDNRNHNKHY